MPGMLGWAQPSPSRAGFAQVLEAIRQSGKPGVVHNGMLDVAYTLEAFMQPLPPSWAAYKRLVQHWFPGALFCDV